jgi:hypothetical protein
MMKYYYRTKHLNQLAYMYMYWYLLYRYSLSLGTTMYPWQASWTGQYIMYMYIHVNEPKCTVTSWWRVGRVGRCSCFCVFFLEGKKKKPRKLPLSSVKKVVDISCWRAMKSLLIFYEIHMTFIEIFKNQVAILMPDFISKNIIWRKRD